MRLLCAVLLTLCSLPALAQKEDWLPITQQDLQYKEVPGAPGTAAVQLYYANYIVDSAPYEFIYHRIKILNESGKSQADVEIRVDPGTSLGNLKARTIHPDGSIVEFTGKPFEKTVIKGRGFKFIAKTFTFPEVTVGSIIEYKYRLNDYTSDYWVLQHDLFTVHEKFAFHPGEIQASLSWVGTNLGDRKPVKKDGWELELDNMPAFEEEASMPPAVNYEPTVQFFYVREDINSADKFWREVGKELNERNERVIGNHKEVREAALQAIGNETDPEKKLQKLYERAQQIRNLSYERDRTEQERKKEKLKENESVVDVVKRGYGDWEDITAFFVGMARAAGFDATMLYVSNRRDSFFSDKLLTIRTLGGRIALVTLNGKQIYLQPGVLYCPYGLLRWSNTSTQAFRVDKKGGAFITVPPQTSDRSLTKRTAKMALSEDGTLKGTVTVDFEGEEALEHRLDARDRDDAGKKKDLEDELKQWLPGGAKVELASVQGWDTPNTPLTATFQVEISGYGSSAGKRYLFPSMLFVPAQKHAFEHGERKYPVYYPYAFTEHDRVSIQLPAGYSLETVPSKQDVQIPYAHFQSVNATDGKQLVSERALAFNAIFVPLNQYQELKGFMSKVQDSDGQQAVLRQGVTNAQKGN